MRHWGLALFLAACRPEPIAVAEPEAVPEPTAAIGTAIAIAELGEPFQHRGIVDDAGNLDVPLCGPALVQGATADEVCDRVAQCLLTALREPLVQVAFDRARASCSATGQPASADDELLATLAAALPRTQVDAELVAEVVDLVVDRHTALARRTEAHPNVKRQTERATRLLATMRDGGPASTTAAPHLARRLDEAERQERSLAESIGPKHPRAQQLQRRLAALRQLAAAVGSDAASSTANAFVLTHETALLEGTAPPTSAPPCPGLDAAFALRIAYWQGRRDAALDPTHAESILDGLMQARASARAACVTRRPRP